MAKQSITQSTVNVTNIQSLPDIVIGQATELKTTFDKTGLDTKTYINTVLIAELNGDDGSKKIGHNSINITSDNVSEAIEEIRDIAIQAQAGTIIDGSILDVKLSNVAGQIKDRVSTLESEIANKLTKLEGTNTIPITGWVGNTGDYVYKLDLAVVEILSTDTLMISINKDDVDVKNDADMPDAETYDGGIRFFAKNIPTATIGFSYTRLR
jgi:hypothetical protein